MLAIAQRESQFFPYTVSEVDAKGLFQLTPIAVKQDQETFFKEVKEVDLFDVDQNIELGILYFKYLKNVYQNEKDPTLVLQQQLAAWNWGQGHIPSDKKFNFNQQPTTVQQFVGDILQYQRDCEQQKIKQAGKINLPLLLAGCFVFSCLILSLGLCCIHKIIEPKDGWQKAFQDWDAVAGSSIDVNSDGKIDLLMLMYDRGPAIERTNKVILVQGDSWRELLSESLCGFMGWEIGDFNQNGKTELLIRYDDFGMAGWQSWYLYEWKNNNFELLIDENQILSNLEVEDMDNDGFSEIIQTFWPYEEPKSKQIFKWNEQSQRYLPGKVFPVREL
ncbi:MAG: hypothetical protein AUJ25_01345 [Parcubacteria group bacterium CG1_02_37_13]|nr:MAG: hypothetical protein AUJ25_01345 [Parcubacteria group bacterium CG1_02_37_13]